MASKIACLALLALGCSAPHYLEASPFASQGELVHRGGSLDEEGYGLMFTLGWNLQAERHHREMLLETARAGGHETPIIHIEGDEAPPPPEGKGNGTSNALIAGGIVSLLGALAFAIRKWANRGSIDEEAT